MTVTGLIIMLMFVGAGIFLNVKALIGADSIGIEFQFNYLIWTLFHVYCGYRIIKDLIRAYKDKTDA